MKRSKYLIIILFITAVLFSLTVSNFFSSSTHNYKITNSEIRGASYLQNLSSIKVKLQLLRGWSQLQDDKIAIKNISLIKRELKQSIMLLPSSLYKNELSTFLNSLQPYTSFEAFSIIIKKNNTQSFEYAKKYKLLFEPNPELYYMMSILVFHIPNLTESLATIRGVALKPILDKKISLEYKNQLQQLFRDYQREYKNILRYLKLITSFSTQDTQIVESLKEAHSKTGALKSILLTDIASLNSHSFFERVTNINNTFTVFDQHITNNFIDQLNERKRSLFNQIMISILLLIFAIILLIFFTLSFIQNKKRLKEKYKQELYKRESIESLKETLYHETSVDGLSEQITKFFCNEYNAVTGVLYLYDKTNNEMLLGHALGMSISNLATFIPADWGLIGKSFTLKEMIITSTPYDVIIKTSVAEMQPKELWTIPFVQFDNCIAVLELSFLHNPTFDIEEINYISEIVALILSKTQKEEQESTLLDTIDKHVITSKTNKKGIITYVSHAFSEISGFKPEELLGKTHNIVRHPEMSDNIFKNMWATITRGQPWHGEVKNRTKNGGFYWVDVTITPDIDFYGNILGYTALRQDITDKKKVEEISITDALTGLYNRRYFDTIFEQNLNSAKRENKNLIFVLMDIDHFKQYNDTYGHQDGDTTLIQVSKVLSDKLKRPNDFAFRVGGEEFGALFEAQTLSDAVEFTQLMLQAVENLHIPHQGNSASEYVTISMGMFFFDPFTVDESIDKDEIYKKADEALYKAKDTGRNQLVVWSEP